MVSNAFTSNGYAVLGNTDVGKINALVLVWMGFILSGAGTATLAAAILMRHFKGKFKDYDDKFDDLNNKLDDVNSNLEKLEKLLTQLKNAGLTGIEGYYPEYTAEHVAQYRDLALKLKLALSGGSDFHADMKPHIKIGIGTGNLSIPYYVLENLKTIKRNSD